VGVSEERTGRGGGKKAQELTVLTPNGSFWKARAVTGAQVPEEAAGGIDGEMGGQVWLCGR